MSDELWLALFLLACVLIGAAATAIDRWNARREMRNYWASVAAEQDAFPLLTLMLDDPTADEPGEWPPVVVDEDPAPTLREERVVPTEAALYLSSPHVCLPDCEGRPTVYMGPILQGRRGEAVR